MNSIKNRDELELESTRSYSRGDVFVETSYIAGRPMPHILVITEIEGRNLAMMVSIEDGEAYSDCVEVDHYNKISADEFKMLCSDGVFTLLSIGQVINLVVNSVK